MTVMYEDIAMNPIGSSKVLFEFIGAEFTPDAEQYIYNITMAGHQDNCVICTTRKNSTEHVDTWKQKMPFEFKVHVQDSCDFVLRYFNYTVYSTDELKSMSLP